MSRPSSSKRKADVLKEGAPPTKKAISMKFDDPNSKLHDVCLVAGEQEFYVSKKDLARHSPFFHRMFFGNFGEKDQKVIKLHDVEDPADFQLFLEIINGINNLSDENVMGVALMVHLWEAPIVEATINKFLMEKSQKTRQQKFDIAVQLSMGKLVATLLAMVKNAKELKELLPASPETSLPVHIRDQVMMKSLQLLGLPKVKPEISDVSPVEEILYPRHLFEDIRRRTEIYRRGRGQ